MNGRFNFDGRVFRAMRNSGNGDVTTETIFRYRQAGNVVWAEYQGGAIRYGQLIALVVPDGTLDMRYHHVTDAGELKTGTCRSFPELLDDGRIRLRELWQWTSDDFSSGESVIEEIENGEALP